eukprot:jgi/Mesen1/9516/ME000637S08968
MFSVIGGSFVRPPPPEDLSQAEDILEQHPGLGFDDNLTARLHMTRMHEKVPKDLTERIAEKYQEGAAMAYVQDDPNVSYAECAAEKHGQRVSLVLYGKIDNEAEMRQLYDVPLSGAAAGPCVATSSSAELMLALYCKSAQPETCLEALQGEWSVCLFDELSLYVLAARDASGKAPLFWGTADSGSLLFSSDVRLLTDECPPASGAPTEFPAGCYFESDPGAEFGTLESYVRYPRDMDVTDGEGEEAEDLMAQAQLCGSMFRAGSASDMVGMARIPSHGDITAQ